MLKTFEITNNCVSLSVNFMIKRKVYKTKLNSVDVLLIANVETNKSLKQ